MDDKIRNSETNESEDSAQKSSRRRRTPSADPSDRSDIKTKRRSRSCSRSKTSRSRSPSRDRSARRRRSRSRGHFSPDRRHGRFNRGGYQRDFYNRRRRSPSRSPGYNRGRNRNTRRSRSTSYDRYRNRRNASTSRDRSPSEGRGAAPSAPASNYQQDYAPSHFQPEYPVAQQPFPNQPSFGSFDYVPMMQAPPTSFPAYPPPPSQEFMWNAQIPPPPIISCSTATTEPAESTPAATPASSESDQEQQKRQAAIAAEKKIQRDTIRKQRDDYMKRANALKRELTTLKQQREELASGAEPPSPTTHGFIKENDRLQSQIENKIGTIQNVIEMLNGILSADKSDTESPMKVKPVKETPVSDDSSPERLKTKVIESLYKKRKDSDRSRKDEKSSKSSKSSAGEQINFTFFDPEQHWCKSCSVFPKTAKEYLLHLHSDEHKNQVKPPEIPWHDHLVKDDMPTYPNAPTKRTPIQGLQFFVPSTAWYCKLCTFWIGDLHCASTHLKSQKHTREYEKFIAKNPSFENEWLDERQKAFDVHREKEVQKIQKPIVPPSPPVISAPKLNIAPPIQPIAPSYVNAPNRVFDGIPLQINQRAKEVPVKDVPVNDEVEKKKGKKKKKEKKKRKKSKKKHRHSSSSSSSSSEESSVSVSPERERKISATEKTIDSSTSIRVAMRNAVNAAVPPRSHLKPKSDDEEPPRDVGGWTVVQAEPKAPAPPKAPTISENGEAQNRRDEQMLSQWTPLPVISEKEKQLFEQLKGKLKNRDDKKKEESPAAKPVQNVVQVQSVATHNDDRANDRTSKPIDRRRNESDKEFKEIRDKDRRDAYRKRRSRSPSTPRRDRRSRSPRRDRRRKSRSPSPRRDRRYSRSPRRDRRRDRYSRSRSRSRDRRVDKEDIKSDKINRASDKTAAKKITTSTANSGKKLPFIGRMPVFKKQTTEDESKKHEPLNDVSEEEKLIKKKKQDELKFQIQQKQQLLQLQQKQAEAYNLAHPGTFANIYNTHGTIHHILPAVQPEEYDLMPDPMQYATLMTAPPPPAIPEAEVPHYEESSEPVLPPGIDEDEAVNMELESVVPPPPPPSDNDNLPKDFQDALSIIFDKGVEKTADDDSVAKSASVASENSNEIPNVVMQDETSIYGQMELTSMDSQHSHIESDQNGAANMDIDDQPPYMLYSEEHYVQNHIQRSRVVPSAEQQSIDLAPQNIPTPPIQILDAAGNLTSIPGPVLEVGSDFVMLDPDGNRIETHLAKKDAAKLDSEHDIELQNKRKQELDDLAMLGIDADDLAAQCI